MSFENWKNVVGECRNHYHCNRFKGNGWWRPLRQLCFQCFFDLATNWQKWFSVLAFQYDCFCGPLWSLLDTRVEFSKICLSVDIVGNCDVDEEEQQDDDGQNPGLCRKKEVTQSKSKRLYLTQLNDPKNLTNDLQCLEPLAIAAGDVICRDEKSRYNFPFWPPSSCLEWYF